MTQKVIDNKPVLTTPQLMMQAIDDNFDELYFDAPVLKIAIIGNSMSMSMGFRDSWPWQFSKFCRQFGIKVDVVNWSITGSTLYSALTDTTAHANATKTQIQQCIDHGADIVFVSLGISDTIYNPTRTESQVIQDGKDVHDALHTGMPNAKIVFAHLAPHDITKGVPASALLNEDCIPKSHKLITLQSLYPVRSNDASFLTEPIDSATLEKHAINSALYNAMASYYTDGCFAINLWKIARLGCMVDILHVDSFGAMWMALSVLEWFKDNNGYDNDVMNVDLWTKTGSSDLLVLDDYYASAIAGETLAIRLAAYNGLNLPERIQNWMFAQRHVEHFVGPDHIVDIEKYVTVFFDQLHQERPIYISYTGISTSNLAAHQTSKTGKYAIQFRPVDLGLTGPGTYNIYHGFKLADNTYDVFVNPVTVVGDPPTKDLTAGDSCMIRRGSSDYTIPSAATFTKLTWDTVDYDALGDSNSTDFTAPVTGLYQANLILKVTNATSANDFIAAGVSVEDLSSVKTWNNQNIIIDDSTITSDVQGISSSLILYMEAGFKAFVEVYMGAGSGVKVKMAPSRWNISLIKQTA